MEIARYQRLHDQTLNRTHKEDHCRREIHIFCQQTLFAGLVQKLGHQSPVVGHQSLHPAFERCGLGMLQLLKDKSGNPRELLNKTDVGQEDSTQGLQGIVLPCLCCLLEPPYQRLVRPIKNSQPDGLLTFKMLEDAPLGDADGQGQITRGDFGWAALSGQSQGRLNQFCLAVFGFESDPCVDNHKISNLLITLS